MRIDFFRRSLIIAWVVAFVGANALAVPSSAAGVMPRGAQIVSGASSAVDTRLGVNLDDLAQTGSVVFTDAMKQAAPWTSDRALSLDANGNVTQLAPGQVAQTLIYPYAVYPSGDYTLLYDGRGTIDIDPQSGTITRVAAGRAVVHVAARLGYGSFGRRSGLIVIVFRLQGLGCIAGFFGGTVPGLLAALQALAHPFAHIACF